MLTEHGEMIPGGWDGLCACGICADDPVERAALVAMSVEETDEVSSVLVAERNCYILEGHSKLVDHVPARDVVFCAYRVAGPWGAIVGGLGFAVPAVVMVLALSVLPSPARRQNG